MPKEAIAVLVCRVGQPPVIEFLPVKNQLEAVQTIVGGYFACLKLEVGIELWCNDDASGLPLNRKIPGVGPETAGFNFVIDMTEGRGAAPGAPGEHHIHGDFLIVRVANEELTQLTAADSLRYQALLA